MLQFFHELSHAKILQLCLETSIPFGIDDPEWNNTFSKIIVDLYNGVKKGVLSKGEIKPTSTVVIFSPCHPYIWNTTILHDIANFFARWKNMYVFLSTKTVGCQAWE